MFNLSTFGGGNFTLLKTINFLFLFLLLPVFAFSQVGNGRYSFDVNQYYGNIAAHSNAIRHLIVDHPEGVVISFNRKTFGDQEWHHAYNFPDFGASFHYENTKNETLGNLYGVFGHYNFYFLNRHLMFRVAQGLAYNSNPYDKVSNFRNIAYGTSFMPSTYFMLNFQQEDIFQGFGVQAGLSFFHHSNANVQSPNTSTNTIALNVGLHYSFSKSEKNVYQPHIDSVPELSKKIQFDLGLRGGINESDIIGSGKFPLFVLSANANKRLGRKSAVQVGTDVFWSLYLKEYIKFKSVAYPNENIAKDSDYRRVGVFVGHELFINKLSVEAQLGYYVYAPFPYLGPFYQRVGMKYYLNDKIFTSMSLKTHGAKAEALEFGAGIKL